MPPSFDQRTWDVDYPSIVRLAATNDVPTIASLLAEELPYEWRDAYLRHTPRQTNLLRVQDEGFTYLFDYYSALGEDTGGLMIEDRLVCAFGASRVGHAKRNVGRQRGWVGPTEKRFGADRDKGHYIPHSLGGGLEINLFDQSRALNRGRSVPGRVYRTMERYCLEHSGIFLFNRPLYADATAKPAMLEFGLLKTDGQLWVERFEN